SAYDAIAVSASELRSARPAVLNALWHYVECGGVLFVLGPGEAPASWRRAGEAPLSNGRLLTAGFGKCFLLDAEQPGGIGAATAKAMMAALDDAAAMWRSLPDENTANSFYPVVENAQIPVRGMVFIMLVFVIVIGPANLIYLSWTGRRTWLLWTIPAISVLATVMVFAYTTLREGITPDVRMEALTFLDQSTRRAASVGITAFYCPLTPSGGLFFSAETEATALVQGWNHQSDSSREVDWTRGQHFRRGWVTARVPAHFWLRKAETRRERIQLEMEGGKLIAVNGLGAPIQSLWLSDHDGRIYTATNVAAGQRTVLLPSSAAVSTSKEVPLRALASTALGYSPWEKAAGDVLSLLTPGSYIAELEGNPFVENALGARSITSRSRIKSTVYGLLEPAGAP
ncbi:MAG TPA: hypothetical protein PLH97_14855, partial [Verrucomicrobiota bacterium]|nr:hypothetical protein [Verrucomicrobiota bacterium]